MCLIIYYLYFLNTMKVLEDEVFKKKHGFINAWVYAWSERVIKQI